MIFTLVFSIKVATSIKCHHFGDNALADQAGYFVIVIIIISLRKKSIKDGMCFVINFNVYIFIVYYVQVIGMVFCPRVNSPRNEFTRYIFNFMLRKHE
ncbi:hypothetical protein BSQ79_01580 [Serratia marcescens]|nr:hypothetical protein BSQ79_01580 [Serratia marcescens]